MSQDSQHTDNRIPEFGSRQEEAEFWDSHDFADFWDELEPIQIEVGDNLACRVSLRLDADSLEEVCILAHEKGISPGTLIRTWVKERLKDAPRTGLE